MLISAIFDKCKTDSRHTILEEVLRLPDYPDPIRNRTGSNPEPIRI